MRTITHDHRACATRPPDRNRAAACERAGIEPATVVYDGDPVAYVLARNDRRRHMTKGQRAMAAWMTASTDSSGITTRELAAAFDISQSDTAQAKVVAEHAPDLVGPVVITAGAEVDANRRRVETEASQLAELSADLRTLVANGVQTLDEAREAAELRERIADLDADLAERVTDGVLGDDLRLAQIGSADIGCPVLGVVARDVVVEVEHRARRAGAVARRHGERRRR